MKKMKRILCLFMTGALAMSLLFGLTIDTGIAEAQTVKHLTMGLKSNLTSITVKWKKEKCIKKYVIYRTDVTKDVQDNSRDYVYNMSQYKKIGEVSGKTGSFTDKTAKKDHYYAYVVKAFKKIKGKYVLTYTSYSKDYYDYACRGLGTPDLLNGGDGENYSNSIKCIYLYHQSYSGVNPGSVILYRKAKGDSKYKKVKFKTVEKIRNLAGVIKDTTVSPGKTYYYRIKTKREHKGNIYYSRISKALRIPVVNVTGKFAITAKPVSGNPDEITIKFKSDKLNGTLTLSQSQFSESKNDGIRAIRYSYDNVTWKSMSESNAVVKPGKTIYIQFSGNDIAKRSEFSVGDEDEGSLVSVSYDSSVFRPHILHIDLSKNNAEARPFYD